MLHNVDEQHHSGGLPPPPVKPHHNSSNGGGGGGVSTSTRKLIVVGGFLAVAGTMVALSSPPDWISDLLSPSTAAAKRDLANMEAAKRRRQKREEMGGTFDGGQKRDPNLPTPPQPQWMKMTANDTEAILKKIADHRASGKKKTARLDMQVWWLPFTTTLVTSSSQPASSSSSGSSSSSAALATIPAVAADAAMTSHMTDDIYNLFAALKSDLTSNVLIERCLPSPIDTDSVLTTTTGTTTTVAVGGGNNNNKDAKKKTFNAAADASASAADRVKGFDGGEELIVICFGDSTTEGNASAVPLRRANEGRYPLELQSLLLSEGGWSTPALGGEGEKDSSPSSAKEEGTDTSKRNAHHRKSVLVFSMAVPGGVVTVPEPRPYIKQQQGQGEATANDMTGSDQSTSSSSGGALGSKPTDVRNTQAFSAAAALLSMATQVGPANISSSAASSSASAADLLLSYSLKDLALDERFSAFLADAASDNDGEGGEERKKESNKKGLLLPTAVPQTGREDVMLPMIRARINAKRKTIMDKVAQRQHKVPAKGTKGASSTAEQRKQQRRKKREEAELKRQLAFGMDELGNGGGGADGQQQQQPPRKIALARRSFEVAAAAEEGGGEAQNLDEKKDESEEDPAKKKEDVQPNKKDDDAAEAYDDGDADDEDDDEQQGNERKEGGMESKSEKKEKDQQASSSAAVSSEVAQIANAHPPTLSKRTVLLILNLGLTDSAATAAAASSTGNNNKKGEDDVDAAAAAKGQYAAAVWKSPDHFMKALMLTLKGLLPSENYDVLAQDILDETHRRHHHNNNNQPSSSQQQSTTHHTIELSSTVRLSIIVVPPMAPVKHAPSSSDLILLPSLDENGKNKGSAAGGTAAAFSPTLATQFVRRSLLSAGAEMLTLRTMDVPMTNLQLRAAQSSLAAVKNPFAVYYYDIYADFVREMIYNAHVTALSNKNTVNNNNNNRHSQATIEKLAREASHKNAAVDDFLALLPEAPNVTATAMRLYSRDMKYYASLRQLFATPELVAGLPLSGGGGDDGGDAVGAFLRSYFHDGVHLSAKGHSLMARLMYRYISNPPQPIPAEGCDPFAPKPKPPTA